MVRPKPRSSLFQVPRYTVEATYCGEFGGHLFSDVWIDGEPYPYAYSAQLPRQFMPGDRVRFTCTVTVKGTPTFRLHSLANVSSMPQLRSPSDGECITAATTPPGEQFESIIEKFALGMARRNCQRRAEMHVRPVWFRSTGKPAPNYSWAEEFATQAQQFARALAAEKLRVRWTTRQPTVAVFGFDGCRPDPEVLVRCAADLNLDVVVGPLTEWRFADLPAMIAKDEADRNADPLLRHARWHFEHWKWKFKCWKTAEQLVTLLRSMGGLEVPENCRPVLTPPAAVAGLFTVDRNNVWCSLGNDAWNDQCRRLAVHSETETRATEALDTLRRAGLPFDLGRSVALWLTERFALDQLSAEPAADHPPEWVRTRVEVGPSEERQKQDRVLTAWEQIENEEPDISIEHLIRQVAHQTGVDDRDIFALYEGYDTPSGRTLTSQFVQKPLD